MEKKQIKISLGTFIVGTIAIILIVVIVIMGLHISNQNKALEESQIAMTNKEKELQQEKVSKTSESETNNKTKILDINSNLVQELYKIPLKYNNMGDYGDVAEDHKCYLGSFYKDNPTTYQNLSDMEKTIAILNNVDENKVKLSKMIEAKANEEYNLPKEYRYGNDEWSNSTTREFRFYDNNLISDTAKKIFGNNYKKDIKFHTIDDGFGSALVYVDGNFVQLTWDGGGGGREYLSAKSKLIKAEQIDDNIYLYDKYMFIVDEREYDDVEGVETYYLTSDMTQKIATVYSDNNYDDTTYTLKNNNGITELTYKGDWDNYNLSEQYFNKYSDNLYTYKHTFKKASDGTYYWVSSELTNKNDLNISNQNSNIKPNSENKILLEGTYAPDASDIGYEFDKNGNVSIFGNVEEQKGTYTTIGKDEVEAIFTLETIWNDETGESTSTKINRTEKIKVIDENTLLVNNVKLIKWSNN